jgi:hypothetical protein
MVHSDDALTPVRARLRAVVGAVWRATWSGSPDVDAAVQVLREELEALYAMDGEARRLALLGSTWMALARDEDPLGTAWQIDELLPAPIGPVLRQLVDRRGERPALQEVWQPVHFGAARVALTELTKVQPNFRANPAPDLFGEAREDAQALLRAAASGDAMPEVRLLQADVEDWASEARGTHQLLRGVKVWKTLVEWMRRLQREARKLAASWCPGAAPKLPSGLQDPMSWASRFPCDPELAKAWLYDLDVAPRRGLPPVLLRPRDGLIALGVAVDDLEVLDRAAWLYLVDEALEAAPGLGRPGWATDTHKRLRELEDEVATLLDRARRRARVTDDEAARAKLEEVIEQLEEASGQLDDRRVHEALEWAALARETLDDAVADAQLAEAEARAAALWRRLRLLDRLPDVPEPPAAGESDDVLLSVLADLEAAWSTEVDALRTRLAAMRDAADWLHGDRDRRLASDALRLAHAAIETDELRRASRALDQVARLVDGARAALDGRLDAGLLQLLHRARRAGLAGAALHGLEQQLARCRDRADVGLPTATHREALTALVAHVEGATASPAVLAVGASDGLQPVLWWDAAVPVADQTAVPAAVVPDKLYLMTAGGDGWSWEKLPSRRERFVPVVDSDAEVGEASTAPPHLDAWSGRLFLQASDVVHGPYVVRDGTILPADARGLVGTLPADDFWDLFGGVDLPALSTRERHVVDPPALHELVSEGGQLLDRLGDERAEHWLERLVEGIGGLDAGGLARAVDLLEAMELPEEVRQARLTRLRPVLGAAEEFAEARSEAVTAWLGSAAGEAAVKAAARDWVAERQDLLDAAVAVERERLASELQSLEDERDTATQQLDRLRVEVDAIAKIRDDARFAVLAGWGMQGSAAARTSRLRPLPPVVTRRPVGSMRGLVDRAVSALGGSEEAVANLVLTLVTSPLVVCVGGVEPTAPVERLLRWLGSDTLSLTVRGGWQDDAALFGALDDERWRPSSDGLVEHLVHATRCWAAGRDGLHAVVFDELLRADPARYLSRVVSAARTGAVSLYAPSNEPSNAAAYPASVGVGRGVRWVLGHTWSEATPLPGWLLNEATVLRTTDWGDVADPAPVSWRDVTGLVTPASRPGVLTEVFDALAALRAPVGRRAEARILAYLGAAEGVLTPADAMDLQLCQVVLPRLRGAGPRFGEGLDGLASLLSRRGFRRATSQVEAMRRAGRELGDFYDALDV